MNARRVGPRTTPLHTNTLTRLSTLLAERYAVEREIGAGGAATVYLARDLKHDRRVALKVLRPELSVALGAERFLGEIRTTARLAHPHILALYDSGDADGMLYYVMPFVEGETVRQRLARDGRFTRPDALALCGEVADALSYAHAQGVVHRDIKPENILLQRGHAVVADFGIARVLGSVGSERLTHAGLVVGTPLYMSPEQASDADDVDGRTDVYSLACVLFEMLCGEPPFTGSSMQAVLTKRFSGPAPRLSARQSGTPEWLDDALARAMEREPTARTPSAAAFAGELSRSRDDAPKDGAPRAPTGPVGVATAGRTPCIAVLPFANMSSDPDAEYFSDGIAEELLNALAKLGGLRVIARTSSFAFKGRTVDVREIGRQLGAGHLLDGSVRKAGNRLRVSAQLIDAATGEQLWSERYDRDMTDVFAVQDEITATIRAELSRHLLGIGPKRKSAAPAIDPETYALFLRGRHLIDRRVQGMHQGMELLRQVVSRAPGFAEGYAALADAYAIQTFYAALPPVEGFTNSRAFATRALELDPLLARAHTALGNAALYFDWNWPEAHDHYARAREIAPDDPWCVSIFAIYWASLGRGDDARRLAEHAVSVDPLSPSSLSQLSLVHWLTGRFDECVAVCDRIIEIAPDFSEAHRVKGMALLLLRRSADALPVLEEAMRLSGRNAWTVSNMIAALFYLRRYDEARALAAELDDRARSEPVPAYLLGLAACHREKPDIDTAFAQFERSVEARDFWLVMLRVDAAMSPLRHDPRFPGLVARVGIPESPARSA